MRKPTQPLSPMPCPKKAPLRKCVSAITTTQCWYELECGHQVLGPVVKRSAMPHKLRCHECRVAAAASKKKEKK